MVAKYSETTFALILPGALLRNAVCIGERLRKEIRRTGIMMNGQPMCFTVSLGIVEVADGDEMATHVERACAQLAQASKAGGNRTGFVASIAS
jgi:PleD family two-component response regulator